MIEEISGLLGNFIVNTIFGDLTLTGIFLFIFLLFIGVALRLSIDAMIVIMVPLLYLLMEYGLLGELGAALKPLFLIGLGILLAIALLRLVRKY